jgi:predicted amidohydrolase YtcJ
VLELHSSHMKSTIIRSNILTMDERLYKADAVLVVDGKIMGVGTCEDMTAMSPSAQVLEHRDQWLTPGLTDAHIHLVGYGFSLRIINLEGTTSSADALTRIRARLAEFRDDPWVLGRGFNINAWNDATYPTAMMLDGIVRDQPAMMRSRDGHSFWVNSRALELAGIHAGTPDPAGGVIVRDDHGNPTGTLLENAMELVKRVLPEPSLEAAVEAGRLGAEQMRAYGFTAVHTMALEPNRYVLAKHELEARGELPLRVWACVPHADLEHLEALGLRGGVGNRVRLGGVKFFADGALGSRTALMLEDYEGFPGERGVQVDTPETVFERGSRALELGFSPVIHAIGDRANHDMLDVLERLTPLARQRNVRLRLEHAQHLAPQDVERFGLLGIVASVQPIHLAGDTIMTEKLLGAARAKTTYAFRRLLETGATLALGSDAPVATPDPVRGFEAAVERIGADGKPWHTSEALTRLETLRGYTVGAALAAGWEGWYGRVAPGCAADFTLWDGDPLEAGSKPLEALTL